MKLKYASRFEIVPLAPFNFQLTVKKPAGWNLFNSGEIFHDGTLWTATRMQKKLVGLKLHSVGTLTRRINSFRTIERDRPYDNRLEPTTNSDAAGTSTV
jgi:hypothetical protein